MEKIVSALLKDESKFEKYDFGKSLLRKYEIEFCQNMFNKSKDKDICDIIEYKLV